jgi:DnaK suppressor protein
VDRSSLVAELEVRRRHLQRELDRLTAPPEPGGTIGFGKRIGEGTTEAIERLTTTASARSLTASLADVDRALEKVTEGTYGRCDRCGGVIPDERLEARPTTAHCVACATP